MDNYNRVPDDHTGLADLCRGTVTADTAIVYTETALGRLGHPIERLRTIQRIRKCIVRSCPTDQLAVVVDTLLQLQKTLPPYSKPLATSTPTSTFHY